MHNSAVASASRTRLRQSGSVARRDFRAGAGMTIPSAESLAISSP
jgi:hypothetical protein